MTILCDKNCLQNILQKQNGNTVRLEKNTSTNAWITSQLSQSSQSARSSRSSQNTNGVTFKAQGPSVQNKIVSREFWTKTLYDDFLQLFS